MAERIDVYTAFNKFMDHHNMTAVGGLDMTYYHNGSYRETTDNEIFDIIEGLKNNGLESLKQLNQTKKELWNDIMDFVGKTGEYLTIEYMNPKILKIK